MSDNRRSFIKKFGIALGSLIASASLPGCGAKKDGGLSDTPSQVEIPNEPAPTARAPEWEQLRQCWLKLNTKQDIRNRQNEGTWQGGFPLMGLMKPDILAKEHQAILNTLVAKGQLQEPVAEHMQTAFDEATIHFYIVSSQMMCYGGHPLTFSPRLDLFQQAEALRKISGNLDPATVAKAQAALTQDIAFFEIYRALPEGAEVFGTCPDRVESLMRDYATGKLKAGPEELEAARLLTELFLQKPD
jgi:hypothetical protein